jgi:hypothetical protein
VKADLRYQNGCLYEQHGSWYVRYRQRISQQDGSRKLNRAAKHLGRSGDFSNIFEVERCRASFMQAVNRDRLSEHSRITLTAFVEGAYLPWTKEERRASTSKGHQEIWINHIRGHVGELHLREFRTVDASRMLRAIAEEKDLTKTTLQHIKSVLSTIFTYAKNEGAFDGTNPVDGVLIPMLAREPGQTHAYDLDKVLQILDLLPLLAKTSWLRSRPSRGYAKVSCVDSTGLIHRQRIGDQSFHLDVGGQPSQDASQPGYRAGNSCFGGNLERVPQVHG